MYVMIKSKELAQPKLLSKLAVQLGASIPVCATTDAMNTQIMGSMIERKSMIEIEAEPQGENPCV